MLFPRKVKHRKWMKGRRRHRGVAARKSSVAFGEFGLKAEGHAWLSSREIEAARRVITHYTKRGGKLWIRVFPDKPITKKGAEQPMGKGKGSVDHYVAVVKPGMVILELDGIPKAEAEKALTLAGYKLSVKTRVIARE